MTDNGRLRTLHRRAVEYSQQGDGKRWAACLVARRIVGQYEKGATLALAQDIGRSVDTVERMADAATTYRILRPMFRDVSELRRKLSWSHFAVLGRKWGKYEFEPAQAVDYLRDAAEHGVSVRMLENKIDAEHGPPPPPTINKWNVRVADVIRSDGNVQIVLDVNDDISNLCIGQAELRQAEA